MFSASPVLAIKPQKLPLATVSSAFMSQPVGYCFGSTQVILISKLYISITDRRAVAQQLLMQLTQRVLGFKPLFWRVHCYADQVVENNLPLSYFGPSWLIDTSDVMYKQPFPHKWDFIMGKMCPFLWNLYPESLSGIEGTYLLNYIRFYLHF